MSGSHKRMSGNSKSNKKDTKKKAAEEEKKQKEEPKPVEDPDDDWNGEFDPNEYEAKMSLNIRRVIAAESQFQKTIEMLRQLKIKQLNKRREEVHAGNSQDLHERCKSAYSDCKEKDDAVNKVMDLHMDVLDRQVEGLKYFAKHGQKDTYEAFKAKLEEDLLAEEAKLEEQLRDYKNVVDRIKETFIKKKIKSVKSLFKPPKKVKLGPNYKKIEKKRKQLNVPLVVYNLTDREIREDLSLFDDAIQKAEAREQPRPIVDLDEPEPVEAMDTAGPSKEPSQPSEPQKPSEPEPVTA